MELTVTIPADEVAALEAFVRKRFSTQYPGWDTTAVDVIQVMLDDHAEDQHCEAAISTQRWAIADAVTDEELTTATAAESAARDAKIAAEAARSSSRA